ncbi:MurR/RpiR family transcriptional regulator [Aquibacillus sp. 3ASR75-11]|uniref:MurR/RpiR family transcriptional regulator n=1 Tax=Terrihalobacillus insolitus TaxID=2950438 RepID=A0A9X4AMZ0_9BACI|nr:MurR/RpiR family transcriptional regulator [Terrihalobacillus insolitus]MDC3413779.1 MurR/RpiR family transcriptional regulator [Terrihalobacillus insolitus]MDC3425947.1 MurR/RpiR family transcriptional regulator [Terrihalobacillus insolitus]
MEEINLKLQTHYGQFSKGQLKVARLLESDPKSFAISSAEQVGKHIGVSETTVFRFCHALGYSGYSELQKEIQKSLLGGESSLKEYGDQKASLSDTDSFHKKVMLSDSNHILTVADRISEQDFNLAVSKLATAEKILITGARSSFSVAQWLAFALNVIRGGATCYKPNMDDLIYELSKLNEESVFIALSFHRYARDTIDFAQEARKKGAYIIGITDSDLAPIRAQADLLLPIKLPFKSTLDTAPVVFSLMNALIAGVTMTNPDQFETRRKEYENFHANNFFTSLQE